MIESERYFVIEIEEILQKLVVVKAKSKIDALMKAKEKYNSGQYILNDNDFKETNFTNYTYSDPTEMTDLIMELLENEEKDKELYEKGFEING